MDEESQNVKHLKLERRRRQFEATSRYGRPGATRRKARDLNSNMELEIIRPTNSDFLVLTTEVDSAWALPLHDKHGLTGLRLEEFERYLAAFAVQEGTDREGRKVATFRVPGSAWVEGRDTAEKQRARYDRLQLAGRWSAFWSARQVGVPEASFVEYRIARVEEGEVLDRVPLGSQSALGSSHPPRAGCYCFFCERYRERDRSRRSDRMQKKAAARGQLSAAQRYRLSDRAGQIVEPGGREHNHTLGEEHTMDQHEMTPRWMHPQPLSRAASLESPGRALLQAALQHPANLDTTQQGDWVFA